MARLGDRKPNDFIVEGSVVTVILRRKDGSTQKMLCDLADWKRLKHLTWHVSGYGYAANHQHKRRPLMLRFHQQILRAALVDHINEDRLDNRRANLRPATHTQNMFNKSGLWAHNTSGYRCVFWSKQTKTWYAKFLINKKKIHSGGYKNKYEAALAYNMLITYHAGEFARLNPVHFA